jgi:acyl-coenzyme A thioesterase 9
MNQTKMHATQIMQPQYRNRHNFMIFGGFLLKQTFELAFCCAAAFSHTRPTFLSLDPSTFANPVPVGSVLYLKATVAYTDAPLIGVETKSEISDKGSEGVKGGSKGSKPSRKSNHTKVQIRIDSSVRNVEHAETKPTGQFNYTFLVEKDIKVMPRTYSEFMIWVDARRRAERGTPDTAGEVEAEGGMGAHEDGRAARVIE